MSTVSHTWIPSLRKLGHKHFCNKLRGETGNMGQRVICDNAEKQLQLETRVCTAALWLVDLKLQQLTKLEVNETEWRMQDYRFIFYSLLLQKTVSLN